MNILLGEDGTVVKLSRGDRVTRGQAKSRYVYVEWEEGKSPIDTGQYTFDTLAVEICITRPVGDQSGWQTMLKVDGENKYYYILQGWDTDFAGPAKAQIRWYNINETEESMSLEKSAEITFIIDNGVIAQPLEISNENYSALISMLLPLNNQSLRKYDVRGIPATITYIPDATKTAPALYYNFAETINGVPESGVLLVFMADNSQVEYFFTNSSKIYIRHYIEDVMSEFENIMSGQIKLADLSITANPNTVAKRDRDGFLYSKTSNSLHQQYHPEVVINVDMLSSKLRDYVKGTDFSDTIQGIYRDIAEDYLMTSLNSEILYGTDIAGEQAEVQYSTSAKTNTLVKRDDSGSAYVAYVNEGNDDSVVNVKYLTTKLGEKLSTGGGTVSGDLTISGNLLVKGETTISDVETMEVQSNYIVTNSSGATLTDHSGIVIRAPKPFSEVFSYALVYDVASDAVVFGESSYKDGELSFISTSPIAIRSRSELWNDGDISVWDDILKGFIDSNVNISDILTKIEAESTYAKKSEVIRMPNEWMDPFATQDKIIVQMPQGTTTNIITSEIVANSAVRRGDNGEILVPSTSSGPYSSNDEAISYNVLANYYNIRKSEYGYLGLGNFEQPHLDDVDISTVLVSVGNGGNDNARSDIVTITNSSAYVNGKAYISGPVYLGDKDNRVSLSANSETRTVSLNGNLSITGDFLIEGDVKPLDVESLLVKDQYIIANSEALEPAGPTGFVVKTGSNVFTDTGVPYRQGAYGILYNKDTQSMDLAQLSIEMSTGELQVFSKRPVAVRDDSSNFTKGNLIKWDSSGNRFVDSGAQLPKFETFNGFLSYMDYTDANNPVRYVQTVQAEDWEITNRNGSFSKALETHHISPVKLDHAFIQALTTNKYSLTDEQKTIGLKWLGVSDSFVKVINVPNTQGVYASIDGETKLVNLSSSSTGTAEEIGWTLCYRGGDGSIGGKAVWIDGVELNKEKLQKLLALIN